MQMLAPIGFPASPSVAALRCWLVVEVDDDDGTRVRLAMGWITGTRLRVTSQIEHFEGGQVMTRSGSIYTLDGPPATSQQLQEQSTRREALLGDRVAVDVTELYSVTR